MQLDEEVHPMPAGMNAVLDALTHDPYPIYAAATPARHRAEADPQPPVRCGQRARPIAAIFSRSPRHLPPDGERGRWGFRQKGGIPLAMTSRQRDGWSYRGAP